jgi:hypothetical protein
METEILSDTDRIAANADALGKVESEIASLERMFAGLESLGNERDRLSAAVQGLHTEEAQILSDGATSESAVVKKLIETRARRDVQSARLASTQDKVKEQTAALAVQGTAVRRAFQIVVGRLYAWRETRVTQTLTNLFSGDWIVLRDGKRLGMKDLARQTQLMKQARDLDIKMSHPIEDPAQEALALRQRLRTWLAELTDLVTSEGPGLVLTVPARQPIEEPARELATA